MAREDDLLVGAAEVEITPPVGAALCGSIGPRASVGMDDPLTVKAVVAQSGGERLAYVLLDLIALDRREGDAAAALAAERTGIPASHIVWAASHTHTGPYTSPLLADTPGVVNSEWLAGIPAKFAEAVAEAARRAQPAAMSRGRAYCLNVAHNRRLRYKDGREINTWLLNRGEEQLQCVGAAGPVDPEVGILCFDDLRGNPIAVLWHFALHTNTNFGPRFSADYPAVVQARLRERFGPQLIAAYMPGTCGDINNIVHGYRAVGDALAAAILPQLTQRKPRPGPVRIGAVKEEIVAPYRDLAPDQEARLRASQWAPADLEAFRRELEIMRREGVTEARTVLQAWRIGDVGFASLPGEVFIEWGLKIKKESPFPWTFPVELGGDYLGYLVTRQAWEAGGYESLIARSARISVEGVERMVGRSLEMLKRLHSADLSAVALAKAD